ncbi:hypothetical protein [Acidipropionibacterium acidipropionici]|uniref:hypothetical protein n=1 Tax=Acidipropionibacterium acidipropionici TaxID=1748 RepID=UPI00110B0B78|nr:hypothetical protein [Acidipropionibacterium acidipropionici]QCV96507.1 hypothetical protein FEZ30_15735 [Acidipropionibacterium acidipropionici]
MASYEQIRAATGRTEDTSLSNYPVDPPDRGIILGPHGHIRVDIQDEHATTPVTVLPHEIMAAPQSAAVPHPDPH